MDRAQDLLAGMIAVDWILAGLVLVGLVAGAAAGLGRVFGALLYLLVALWLGRVLAPAALGWLPNTAQPDDPRALFVAYGAVTGGLLVLPVLARILARRGDGRKREDRGDHRVFGALVGGLAGAVLGVFVLPYLHEVAGLRAGWVGAPLPTAALRVADGLPWLYPEPHRRTLALAVGA